MNQELGYGLGQRLRIDVASDALVAHCSPKSASTVLDPRQAVKQALAAPLGFPPLQRAVVPDDQIAIAIPPSIPQAAALVAGIVDSLTETGYISPADIRVVFDGSYSDNQLTSALSAEVAEQIVLERHDPDDTDSLSYLAASQEGKPIYLNRSLVDANVVVPVALFQLDETLGYVGPHGGLLPFFSNEETRRRFRAPVSVEEAVQLKRRQSEAAEAVWLLGSQFTIQVIPGPVGGVLHILAGDAEEVQRQGQPLCEQAWAHKIPRRASLVVASIEGGDEHQTWDNLGRALFTASRGVEDQGTVVFCTRLGEKPGPSLRRLSESPDQRQETLREIRRDRGADAIAAALIAEARERVRIYLMSELNEDDVEDLGIGYISEVEEISRLSQQHDSCVLVSNAHHAAIRSPAE